MRIVYYYYYYNELGTDLQANKYHCIWKLFLSYVRYYNNIPIYKHFCYFLKFSIMIRKTTKKMNILHFKYTNFNVNFLSESSSVTLVQCCRNVLWIFQFFVVILIKKLYFFNIIDIICNYKNNFMIYSEPD